MIRRALRILAITAACVLPCGLMAEEGGSGHYLPGTAASFVDAFPGRPGALAVANYFAYYDASAGINRNFEFGGVIAAGIDATVYADSLLVLYQTPWNVLGGGLAVGAAAPYVSVEVEGSVNVGTNVVRRVRDTANGLGDVSFFPFILGWTNIPDLKCDVRMTIFTPTGDYDVGQLANVGKNYWTFEPGVMVSYLSSKIGTEVSLYAGVDFNTRNDDTGYESGDSFHLDLTLAQHLPLGQGIIGVGASGFYYQQITGDSGSARLGDFEGSTLGVGPVVSYITKLARVDLVAELKWLPELDVEKRLKGDFVWFKLGVLF